MRDRVMKPLLCTELTRDLHLLRPRGYCLPSSLALMLQEIAQRPELVQPGVRIALHPAELGPSEADPAEFGFKTEDIKNV